MDIRQPIHDTPEPTVLSVAFSGDGLRFICGMDNGIRSKYPYRLSVHTSCLTCQPNLSILDRHDVDKTQSFDQGTA